ncbi:MAG: hypothetical protein WCS42_00940 [Verrucomicrobiota bacterium]
MFNFCPSRHSIIAQAASMFRDVDRARRALESPVNRRTIGNFETEWRDKSPFELDLLDTIQRMKTGLVLSRAQGDFTAVDEVTCEVIHYSKPMYRLYSGKHHARIDFILREFRTGYDVSVAMIHVEPQYQGSFYAFRNFLIDTIAETFFNMKTFIFRIFGHVAAGPEPCRGRDWRELRTRDGEIKLARLYERLGLVRMPFTISKTFGYYNPAAFKLFESEDPKEAKYFRESKVHERKRVPNHNTTTL